MKRIIFFISATLTLAACSNDDKKTSAVITGTTETGDTGKNILNSPELLQPAAANTDTSNFTTIYWIDNINQSLPKIKEGEVIEVTYRFRNSGSKPLVIQDVSASCGCTVPEKPNEPIMPGKESLIKAKFDSKGKPGPNTKTLSVLANTNSDKILTFSVDVEKNNL